MNFTTKQNLKCTTWPPDTWQRGTCTWKHLETRWWWSWPEKRDSTERPGQSSDPTPPETSLFLYLPKERWDRIDNLRSTWGFAKGLTNSLSPHTVTPRWGSLHFAEKEAGSGQRLTRAHSTSGISTPGDHLKREELFKDGVDQKTGRLLSYGV